MKFPILAALAASIPFLGGSVDAAPLLIIGNKAGVFQIATLGGAAFRIKQVPSTSFQFGSRRGPVALARAYSKFGVAIPPDLLSIIEAILEELGLLQLGGIGQGGNGRGKGSANGPARTNGTQGINANSGMSAPAPRTGV